MAAEQGPEGAASSPQEERRDISLEKGGDGKAGGDIWRPAERSRESSWRKPYFTYANAEWLESDQYCNGTIEQNLKEQSLRPISIKCENCHGIYLVDLYQETKGELESKLCQCPKWIKERMENELKGKAKMDLLIALPKSMEVVRRADLHWIEENWKVDMSRIEEMMRGINMIIPQMK